MTTVGIVGAGQMGAGIAQVALEAGWEVVLHDVDDDAIERARARIRDGLGRRAAKLDLDADTIDAWIDGRLVNLRDTRVLDTLATEAILIVEAVIEDLALKRT
ncbi:MAG: 3-hydroxyacyl-CoA dehydrogenase NAD-binding domain-containing protein, partial [Candidatus Limnocylindrales bacterium]